MSNDSPPEAKTGAIPATEQYGPQQDRGEQIASRIGQECRERATAFRTNANPNEKEEQASLHNASQVFEFKALQAAEQIAAELERMPCCHGRCRDAQRRKGNSLFGRKRQPW